MRYSSTPGPGRRGIVADSRAGFTLLEVIVALTIVGVAVVSMVASFGAGLRAASGVEARMREVVLAEMKMDALATMPSDELLSYREPRVGRFGPPFVDYSWRAIARPAATPPGLINVAVLVRGPAGEYTLETSLYRPTVSNPAFAMESVR